MKSDNIILQSYCKVVIHNNKISTLLNKYNIVTGNVLDCTVVSLLMINLHPKDCFPYKRRDYMKHVHFTVM